MIRRILFGGNSKRLHIRREIGGDNIVTTINAAPDPDAVEKFAAQAGLPKELLFELYQLLIYRGAIGIEEIEEQLQFWHIQDAKVPPSRIFLFISEQADPASYAKPARRIRRFLR